MPCVYRSGYATRSRLGTPITGMRRPAPCTLRGGHPDPQPGEHARADARPRSRRAGGGRRRARTQVLDRGRELSRRDGDRRRDSRRRADPPERRPIAHTLTRAGGGVDRRAAALRRSVPRPAHERRVDRRGPPTTVPQAAALDRLVGRRRLLRARVRTSSAVGREHALDRLTPLDDRHAHRSSSSSKPRSCSSCRWSRR